MLASYSGKGIFRNPKLREKKKKYSLRYGIEHPREYANEKEAQSAQSPPFFIFFLNIFYVFTFGAARWELVPRVPKHGNNMGNGGKGLRNNISRSLWKVSSAAFAHRTAAEKNKDLVGRSKEIRRTSGPNRCGTVKQHGYFFFFVFPRDTFFLQDHFPKKRASACYLPDEKLREE